MSANHQKTSGEGLIACPHLDWTEEGEVPPGGEGGEEVHRGEDFTGEEGWDLGETVYHPPTTSAGVASSPVTLSRSALPMVRRAFVLFVPPHSMYIFRT